MIIYDINLYDPQTDTVTFVISLQEKRQDYDRPRGIMTMRKLARSVLGEEWWLKNWHNISITQRSHYHRRNGGKIKTLRPPIRGGVD